MVDQNTTTVLTTLITVFGTLGGVVLGVVLSNRYIARQEKTKRNTVVIEEVYTLLINLNATQTDIINDRSSPIDTEQENLHRVRTLIYLYLPSLKEKFDEFYQIRFQLRTEVATAKGKNISKPWISASDSFNKGS